MGIITLEFDILMSNSSIEEQQPEPKVFPTFTHDCDKCTFLGNIHDEDLYDLYYCSQVNFPTVIARFGNDGPNYKSGAFKGTKDPHLKEAMNRAERLNLPL
ncbi:MAG: hypothetical protein ACXW07_08035 [Nitrososphaeraceae archaeon]